MMASIGTRGRCSLLASLLALALFAAVSAAAPSTASAQADGVTATVLFSSPAVAIVGTVFVVADIAYAAESRLLPPEWSIAQLVGAVLELAFSATAVLGIAQGSTLEGPLAGFAAAGLVTGLWHSAHAIWSLGSRDEPEHAIPSVHVAWMDGGGLVTISGSL